MVDDFPTHRVGSAEGTAGKIDFPAEEEVRPVRVGVHEVDCRVVGVSLQNEELHELKSGEVEVDHDVVALVGEVAKGLAIGNEADAIRE